MKKKELFLLALILFGAFLVRFYRFDGPIADWHSWRQADTSAVSRNFTSQGYDFLHPKFDDLSNVASGKDNPLGYRFVEFPLFNFFQAGTYQLFGFFTLEEWGRLVTITSSLLTTLFIYLLTKKHINQVAGFFAAFFFAFTPYNIYYGRVILPDPSMIMASLGGIYFFDKWLEKTTKKDLTQYIFYILAIIFTASAFLLKPYAVFFTLPMIYLTFNRFKLKAFMKWELWVFPVLAFLPLWFWRSWMTQYPEGIPVSEWLFNGNGIRFKPSFFKWIIFERITKIISGYFGVVLIILAIFKIKTLKGAGFLLSFLLSSVIYVCVFATGNVQHDYYQILIMPSIAICYGIGAYLLFVNKIRLFSVPIGKIVLIIITCGMFFYGWSFVKDYFNINNRVIIVAGKAVDSQIPKDAKIIAPYDGDTTFLYQTKRKGWASMQKSLPEMVEIGASYLVLLNPKQSDFDGIGKSYKIVNFDSSYILFDLHQKP